MKRYQYYGLAILFCGLSAALPGCGGSAPARFYTLAPVTVSDGTVARPLATSVYLAPITLPEMVDRPQLVVAIDRHQVQLLEQHRWVEPLKSAIPRIVADNLSRMLGTDRVSWYPQSPPYRAEYRISVDFRRFESSNKQVIIDALWSISSTDKAPPLTGRSFVNEPLQGSTPEALAAAYSKALATMSSEIARVIRGENIGNH